MVGMSRLVDAEERVGSLASAGYECVAEYEAELPERRCFRKPRRSATCVSSALRGPSTDSDIMEKGVRFAAGVAICEAAGCIVSDLWGGGTERPDLLRPRILTRMRA